MPRALKFGRGDFAYLARRYRKGYEGGRNVDLFESTAHGIFSADCRAAVIELRFKRAEQGGQRLTPPLGIFLRFFEIFLEGKIHFFKRRARSDQLCNAFHYGEIRAVIRAFFRNVGIAPPRHIRNGIRVPLLYRNKVRHRLRRRGLIRSAERH